MYSVFKNDQWTQAVCRLRKHRWAVAFVVFFAWIPSVFADDIEVYINSTTDFGPNILFLFDLSGSMAWREADELMPGPGEDSRYDILKSALNQVLSDDLGALNIGLAWFTGDGYNNYATGLKWPISPNSAQANTYDSAIAGGTEVRDVIESILDAQTPYGGTAIVESLYEAARYFRGDSVDLGAFAPQSWDTALQSYTGGNIEAAHPASYTPSNAFSGGGGAANYQSPINGSCQPNYVVLLSDGRPTVLNDQGKIETFLGTSCVDESNGILNDVTDWKDSANCGKELASFLANTDQIPSLPGSRVKLLTVGFALSNTVEGEAGRTFLQALATAGDGAFYEVSASLDLATILSNIVGQVSGNNESFTPPSVAVNPSNLSSSNRTFVSMFKPAHNRSWAGNLKGYFLGSSGFLDVDGNPAMTSGPDGDVFAASARSFWSSKADGAEVPEGGASEKIPSSGRKVYTYLGTSNDLTDSSNSVEASNASITSTMLGLSSYASAAERSDLIDWYRASPYGDPLHSQPVLLDYGSQKVVYIGTNSGFLHAVDATQPTAAGEYSGGDEIFAFVPEPLLKNVYPLKRNFAWGKHIYGLDGDITVWHQDANNDHVVNGADKVLLIAGMRRGGSAYYALDITNPSSPKLKWQINPSVAGFERLGQTWSRATLTTIDNKKVLIFAGGYDADQDNKHTRSSDDKGNAVYIVDAETGHLMWSASNGGSGQIASGMQYAIPSDLAVIDADADGSADRLYFGDMGGQIWRIDIDASSLSTTSGATISRLADFNDGSVSGNRKFFYPPAVALMQEKGQSYIAIAIGSGNRAHPLDLSVDNRMHMLRDEHVDAGPPSASITTVGSTDLYNATDNLLGGDGTDAQQASAQLQLESKQGWYIRLPTGRKALSEPVVFERELIFTTYQPLSGSVDACTSPSASTHYMRMRLSDAVPVANLAGGADTDPLTKNDREYDFQTTGIPSRPTLVFPQATDHVEVYVGRDMVDNFSQNVKRIYWQVDH